MRMIFKMLLRKKLAAIQRIVQSQQFLASSLHTEINHSGFGKDLDCSQFDFKGMNAIDNPPDLIRRSFQ